MYNRDYGVTNTQWAETALLWKFGHNSGKKRDTDAVKGLLESLVNILARSTPPGGGE